MSVSSTSFRFFHPSKRVWLWVGKVSAQNKTVYTEDADRGAAVRRAEHKMMLWLTSERGHELAKAEEIFLR